MRAPFTKRRVINWHFVGPVLVYLAIAIAITVAIVHIAHHGGRATGLHSNAVHISPNDELARELAHCQAIGERAASDFACIAAWTENRRRFFSGGAPTGHPASAAPANAKRASQP